MVEVALLSGERFKAVLKVRAKALEAARLWLNEQGFVEVQGPVLVPAVGERHSSFRVEFFGERAYLNGGLQPYSDVFVEMLEKVYTVAPAFRAERLRSKRHLAEFWRVEVVACGHDLERIIGVQEGMVTRVCQVLCRDAVDELGLLRGSVEALARVRAPFPILTYDEAVERLQGAGCRVHWGEPLSWEMEHELSLMFDKPFFVTEFPVSGETFFHKSHPEKPELSLCADLLAPEGYGEIAGSGEMITEKKVLLRKLKEMKVEPADRRWYLSLKRYGSAPQSGFALGVERLLQWTCRLEDAKEATAFPRKYGRIYP